MHEHFEPEHTAPPVHDGAPPSTPGQHRFPTPPQAQVPSPASADPPSGTLHDSPLKHVAPPQHAWFALPHSHTPLTVHVRFAPHVWPAQQTSPADAPHGSHVGPEPPATQTLPVVHAGVHTGPASTGLSGPASPPEDPPPPLLELDDASGDASIMEVSIVDPSIVEVSIIVPSPIVDPSPCVAAMAGSMTPVSGAPIGGSATSLPFIASPGMAQ
jgi:hypothetical protein